MKTAFAVWDDRIAPVFDVAHQLRVVETGDGVTTGDSLVSCSGLLPVERVSRLAGLGIDHLVCGAVSWSLQAAIEATGIRVVPFVAGEIGQVIESWLRDGLADPQFRMPGRCGRPRGDMRRFGPGGGSGRWPAGGLVGPGAGRGQGRGLGAGRGRGIGSPGTGSGPGAGGGPGGGGPGRGGGSGSGAGWRGRGSGRGMGRGR